MQITFTRQLFRADYFVRSNLEEKRERGNDFNRFLESFSKARNGNLLSFAPTPISLITLTNSISQYLRTYVES